MRLVGPALRRPPWRAPVCIACKVEWLTRKTTSPQRQPGCSVSVLRQQFALAAQRMRCLSSNELPSLPPPPAARWLLDEDSQCTGGGKKESTVWSENLSRLSWPGIFLSFGGCSFLCMSCSQGLSFGLETWPARIEPTGTECSDSYLACTLELPLRELPGLGSCAHPPSGRVAQLRRARDGRLLPAATLAALLHHHFPPFRRPIT